MLLYPLTSYLKSTTTCDWKYKCNYYGKVKKMSNKQSTRVIIATLQNAPLCGQQETFCNKLSLNDLTQEEFNLWSWLSRAACASSVKKFIRMRELLRNSIISNVTEIYEIYSSLSMSLTVLGEWLCTNIDLKALMPQWCRIKDEYNNLFSKGRGVDNQQ